MFIKTAKWKVANILKYWPNGTLYWYTPNWWAETNSNQPYVKTMDQTAKVIKYDRTAQKKSTTGDDKEALEQPSSLTTTKWLLPLPNV